MPPKISAMEVRGELVVSIFSCKIEVVVIISLVVMGAIAFNRPLFFGELLLSTTQPQPFHRCEHFPVDLADGLACCVFGDFSDRVSIKLVHFFAVLAKFQAVRGFSCLLVTLYQ